MRQFIQRSLFLVVALCGLAFIGGLTPIHAGSSLSLIKEAPATVTSGDNIQYQLTCTNGSGEDARNVVIEDVIPKGAEFIAHSASGGGVFTGNQLTFKVPTLAAGASVRVHYRIHIAGQLAQGFKIVSGSAFAKSDNLASTTAAPVTSTVDAGGSRTAAATAPGKIVFMTQQNDDPAQEIYIMDANGANKTRITNDSLSHNSPILSPDGTKIAFVGFSFDNGSTHLYVINNAPQSASNPPIQLTSDPSTDISAGDYPCWTPNGKQIVYSHGRTAYVTDLTPQSASHQPISLDPSNGGRDFSVSPDGRQLAMEYFGPSFQTNIAVLNLNVDGSGNITGSDGFAVVRTNGTLAQAQPAWSPDGAEIAYAQATDGNATSGDLWKVNLLSGARTQLTSGQVLNFRNISWSPDGSLITFGARGPGQKPDGTFTTGEIDSVYTLKPTPATAQGGANYPQILTAELFSQSYDPSFAQVSGGGTSIVATVKKSAALSADATAAAITSIQQGKTYWYRLSYTVKNTTTSTLSSVLIKDLVPAGTVYNSGAAFTESDGNGGSRVVFEISPIAAGETAIGTVAFQVSEFAPPSSTISNLGKNYFVVAGGQQFLGTNDVNLPVTSGPAPSLGVVKTLLSVNGTPANASSVLAPNDELVYLLRFTNTGTVTANNVVATDIAPSNTLGEKASFSDASGTAIPTPDGDKVTGIGKVFVGTYTMNSLAPGQVVFATLNARVLNPANGTVITNTLTVKADNAQQVMTNVSNTVKADAIISIVKGVRFINGVTGLPNQTVSPGDKITYVIKYVNAGTRAATNAVITDALPANTQSSGIYFSDADAKQITSPAGGSVSLTSSEGTASFTIPSIAPKSVGYVTVAVGVKQDAASKAKTVSNFNYNLKADGISITSVPAITNPLHAPLTITKKVSLLNGSPYAAGTKVKIGDVVTYSITVTNPNGSGATAVSSVTADDFIPSGTTINSAGTGTFVQASPSYVKFTIPSLAVGATSTQNFSVKVAAGATDKISNSNYGVQIAGLNRRFTGAPVDVPVFSAAALSISLATKVIDTGSSTQVSPGQNIRYTYTLTNTGGAAVTNARIQAYLPEGTVYNNAYLGTADHPVTGTTPVLSADRGNLTYSLGTLAPGAVAKVTLEAQVQFGITLKTILNRAYAGTGDNNVFISGTQQSLDVVSGGPTAPILKLNKVASVNGVKVTQVSPGDTLTYDFSYSNANSTNSAASLARSASVSETLPAIQTTAGNFFPPIVSSSAQYTDDGHGHLTWNVGDLASLKSGTFNLKVLIPTTAKVGTNVTNSDYRISAINIAGTGTAGATVTLPIVAPKVPSLAVILAAEVGDSQPKTADGKLLPGARIDYTLIARNNGDGVAKDATLTDLLPDGLNLIEGTTSFDSGAPATIKTGTITFNRLSSGIATGVVFRPGDMAKRDVIEVHFSAVVSQTAPSSLTQVKNHSTFAAKDTTGKSYSVDSNEDVQQVSIPTPAPARLVLSHEFRRQVVVRNTEFVTTLIVSNDGGQAAHNILLRYTFQPNAEQVVRTTEGGQKVGATQTVNTIIWDGTGSSKKDKFLTLNPGDSISVQITSKSSTRTNQTLIVGDVADVHEKSSADSHGPVVNPVTRMNLPDVPVVDSLPSKASLKQAFSLKSVNAASAASPSFFDNLTWLFQTIGAKIGSVLFGGNTSKAVQDKITSMDLSTSTSSGSSGQDFAVISCTLARTVKVTPIIAGRVYQVSGPENLVHIVAQGGGNIVAQGGGNIVAQGGGNAISIDTAGGNKLVGDYMSQLVSPGNSLIKSTMLYYGGSNTLIGQDGNGLIGQDGNGIRMPIPSGLVNTNGSNLIAGGSLIGQDGNGLTSSPTTGLIGQDGNGIVAQGGGNIVAQGGGNIVAQGGGNIVAQGGGNVVNLQGNNSFSVTTGN